LVWQCRYGGVEVPDALWRYIEFGRGEKYSANQAEHLVKHPEVAAELEQLTAELVRRVEAKGQVTPSEHRAFGHKAPGHLVKDAKLAWREIRMRVGKPREGSSPAAQQEQNLNRDVTLTPKEGLGKKLRQ